MKAATSFRRLVLALQTSGVVSPPRFSATLGKVQPVELVDFDFDRINVAYSRQGGSRFSGFGQSFAGEGVQLEWEVYSTRWQDAAAMDEAIVEALLQNNAALADPNSFSGPVDDAQAPGEDTPLVYTVTQSALLTDNDW